MSDPQEQYHENNLRRIRRLDDEINRLRAAFEQVMDEIEELTCPSWADKVRRRVLGEKP